MSKFSVGDRVQVVACDTSEQDLIGLTGTVTHVGKWRYGQGLPNGGRCYATSGAEVVVNPDSGEGSCWLESELRKLPGDDSEDPGLTRIKRLLFHSPQTKAKPVKA